MNDIEKELLKKLKQDKEIIIKIKEKHGKKYEELKGNEKTRKKPTTNK